MIMKNEILVRNNLANVPVCSAGETCSLVSVATVVANLAKYGYVLSKDAFTTLQKADEDAVRAWWVDFEVALKEVTGDNRNMSKYVVYKNFPKEVLEMSQAEYWFNQICMYWGVPSDVFAEPEEDRKPIFNELKLKVLHLADGNSLKAIGKSLLAVPAKWNRTQYKQIKYLVAEEGVALDVAAIPFKENMVKIVVHFIKEDIEVNVKSATDVLRLAVGLSDGDVSLKENSKFKNFSRKERRFLLNLLENSSDLEGDVVRNEGKFKKLMKGLHPFDYKNSYKRVCQVADDLYNGRLQTFNSKVEKYIEDGNSEVLGLLQSRAGEFTRRLNQIVGLFGMQAAQAYAKVLSKLTVSQLLKVEKYLETASIRSYRTFAPKGNWTKLQVVENDVKISEEVSKFLLDKIASTLKSKLTEAFPHEISLDESAKRVKLQTNDSDLCPYGRGTSFPIPDDVNFIRTASYWESSRRSVVWYDNGWNFFDSSWNSMGACCWNHNWFGSRAAIFSGDPVNIGNKAGRACQMIDLYLDKLEAEGVRYAVWNVLCYSHKSFNEVEDVYACLQWGKEAERGKTFEPSRCQLSFQLKGDNMTKYIAYIDVAQRELVYMDANLAGRVSSAGSNSGILAGTMPAFHEYLETLPSVYDLFRHAERSIDGVPVVYDDSEVELTEGQQAYVFKPVNESNSFEQVDLAQLLG
jgi:hypothetical protein